MSAFENLPAKLKESLPEVDKMNVKVDKKDKEITTSDVTTAESPSKKKSMFRSVGGFAKSIGLKSSTTTSMEDDGIDAEVDPLNFTEVEIKAARDTKALLLDPNGPHKMKPEEVTARELMLIVCNCKLRPTDAAKKYQRWHDVIKEGTGLQSLASAFDGIGRNAEHLKDNKERSAAAVIVFKAQGRDMHDRGIMWICTHKIPPEEELLTVSNAIVYFTAAHADLKSLRKGNPHTHSYASKDTHFYSLQHLFKLSQTPFSPTIPYPFEHTFLFPLRPGIMTFVLDTENESFEASHGNEAKMQKIWQCMPLRPQRVFILGANMVKRVLINAALALASLFTNEKVTCYSTIVIGPHTQIFLISPFDNTI